MAARDVSVALLRHAKQVHEATRAERVDELAIDARVVPEHDPGEQAATLPRGLVANTYHFLTRARARTRDRVATPSRSPLRWAWSRAIP